MLHLYRYSVWLCTCGCATLVEPCGCAASRATLEVGTFCLLIEHCTGPIRTGFSHWSVQIFSTSPSENRPADGILSINSEYLENGGLHEGELKK